MKTLMALTFLALSGMVHAQDAMRIPAFTAYLDPNPRGASVSERSGITRWEGFSDEGIVVWRTKEHR